MRLVSLYATIGLLIAADCSSTPPRVIIGDGGSVIPPTDDGGGTIPPTDGAPVDVPPHVAGDPGVGSHVAADYGIGGNAGTTASLVTSSITVQPSGSMIIVALGRGNKNNFGLGAPTDNKGNSPYQQVGTMHAYGDYPTSGTAVYSFSNAKGGSGFQLTAKNGPSSDGNIDEMTMFAVEVVDATKVQDAQWAEVAQSSTAPMQVKSASVTTTGPATLISFWWGEIAVDKVTAAPTDSSFSVIDHQYNALDNVQGVVAVKNVTAAGTYNVTWAADPAQDAQVWMIAIQ